MSKDSDWFRFQEDIKDHFDSLGAYAETNIQVSGVRTCHDVDVFVKTNFLGENVAWVIEAKYWKSKVTKAQVLTLRSIVDDVGADRGFIISKAGFQSGAFEAAENTNVTLKTFDELKFDTKGFIEAEVLKTYFKRLLLVEDRYWSHSKKTRIEYGLRHDVIDNSMQFTGQQLLTTARSAIMAAEDRRYPIELESFLKEHKGEKIAYNFQQLSMWLNLNLNHFEEKLLTAEWDMYKNGDYNPDTTRTKDNEATTTEMMARSTYIAKKGRQYK
jgi:hypothetical protein